MFSINYVKNKNAHILATLDDISKNWRMAKKFTPKIKKKLRIMLLKGWLQAIKKTLA